MEPPGRLVIATAGALRRPWNMGTVVWSPLGRLKVSANEKTVTWPSPMFQEEFIEFLERHQVQFDPAHIWA